MNPQYYEHLFKAAEIIVLGMGTVFSALAFFAFIIWLLTASDEKYNRYKIKNYAQKIETKELAEEHNDELITVLAAAAFTVLNKPVRIRTIRFLAHNESSNWASSGRSSLMASHLTKKE